MMDLKNLLSSQEALKNPSFSARPAHIRAELRRTFDFFPGDLI
jgi:hypothetical protein